MLITARQTKEKLIPYTEFTLLLHQYNKECGLNFVDTTNCLNCNSPLLTDYCGDCGQQKAQRISFSLLLKIMQRGIIEFKSPLMFTFLGLLINPGKVYREYLDGRRVTYFNPIRYSFWLLTFSLVFATFFGASIINYDMFVTSTDGTGLPIPTEKILQRIDSFVIYITFFNAIICAAFLKLFFRKEKYNITELYIPCLLNLSQMFLVALALILLGYLDTLYGQLFYFISYSIYFIWGISHLFNQRTWLTYVKVLFSGALSFLLFCITFGFLVVFSMGVKEGFDEAHNAKIESELNTLTKKESKK
jgi:hypothetical protein